MMNYHIILFELVLMSNAVFLMKVCSRFNTSDAKELPQLANTFSARIEMQNVFKNERFTISEHYSYADNKMALEWKGLKQITDYDRKEYRLINTTTRECLRVFPLPSRHHFVFGGNNHIPGSANIFRFGRQYGEKFLNRTTIRDIPCTHWQSCLVSNHSSFIVDYYFSAEINHAVVPVRCEINGSVTRGHNRTRMIHHIYDFYEFKFDPIPKQAFEVPPGTFCQNVVKQPEIPRIPDRVSYALEYHIMDQFNVPKKVIHEKIYYDFKNGVYRSDRYRFTSDQIFVPITNIQADAYGLRFDIHSPYNCKIRQLSSDVYDNEIVNNHFNLRKILDDLRKNLYTFSFEGLSKVRGIDVDVWIYKRNITKQNHFNRLEWYFSSKNTTIASSSDQSVPLRVVGYYGKHVSVVYTMDIFHFDDRSHLQESVMNPIRNCYELGASVYAVTFFMNDMSRAKMTSLTNQESIIHRLEGKFAELGNIDRRRLAVELIIPSKNQIDVRLSVLGWPDTALKRPNNFTNAKDVADRIKNAVIHKDIQITYEDDSGKHVATFKRQYYDVISMEVYPRIERKNKCESSDGNVEAFITIGFGGFFIGAIIMVITLNLLLRRNGASMRSLIRGRERFDKKPESNISVELETPSENTAENAKNATNEIQ